MQNMRMQLFKVEIERADRKVQSYVVATDEHRVAEHIIEHDLTLCQEHLGFSAERVDHILPLDRRTGLGALLESAPVCFASYCEGVGWVPHLEPVQRLRLVKIEELDGGEFLIIAPTVDVAVAIYSEHAAIEDGDARLFRVSDALATIGNPSIRNLPELLGAGPVGIVQFDEETGWSVW